MFSIIVPIYNSDNYLSECLASIDRQTFKDFELVLVDDGSTDCSYKICCDYRDAHQNTKLIQQVNSGQNAARLAGLLESTGEDIIFIDSDDCIRFDTLEKLNSIIQDFNADVICFDYCRGSQLSFSSNVIKSKYLKSGLSDSMRSCGVYRALCSGDFNSLCNKVYKRTLIFSAFNNLQNYDFLRHGEDLFALISVIEQAKSIFYLPECFYFYRNDDSGITSKYSDNDITDLEFVFSHLIDESRKWGTDCELLANTAALKHLYWCLLSLVSSDHAFKDQISRADLISVSMQHICSLNYSSIFSNLRLDFFIPIWLLLNGYYRLAIIWAKAISYIMKSFSEAYHLISKFKRLVIN